MALLGRLVLALVAAAVAWLICVFIGGLIAQAPMPLATYVGHFLETYAILLAILAFLWYLFASGGFTWPWPPNRTR